MDGMVAGPPRPRTSLSAGCVSGRAVATGVDFWSLLSCDAKVSWVLVGTCDCLTVSLPVGFASASISCVLVAGPGVSQGERLAVPWALRRPPCLQNPACAPLCSVPCLQECGHPPGRSEQIHCTLQARFSLLT